MINGIDERVVQMRFDNQQFESGAEKTLGTLGKLKEGLKFGGASDGLKNLAGSVRGVDLSGLSNGVESIQKKFSALGIVGITTIQNLTNSAVNAGKRMVKALTIDPVKTGFEEYETQINAIQTILANTESKGTTLQDVNKALAELNTYADKTIYNFTEMTRNIGTFTAAGIDLKTSTAAIKGIANLAAVSGSNSQKASVAMYQLSQALAAGTVKLQDWNSVVNAGMGGEVFQNALKETARVHNIQIDEMIKKEGSFRETLKNGWLSSDILTETLSKFTGDLSEAQLKAQGYTKEQIKEIMHLGEMANNAATEVKTFTQLWDTLKEAAQSGWTQTWQIMVGDFDEAKGLLTNISNTVGDIIGKQADARNKLLEGGLSTGWKQLLSAGIMDENAFISSLKKVSKGYDVSVSDMIKKSGSFQDSLKEGWLTADILKDSVADLTTKTHNLSGAQLTEKGYTKDQIEALDELNKGLQDGSISAEDFSKKIQMVSGRQNILDGLQNIFSSLAKVLGTIGKAFRDVFPAMKGDELYALTERFKKFTETLKPSEATLKMISRTFKGLFSVMKIGVDIVKGVVNVALNLVGIVLPVSKGLLGITSALGSLVTKITETLHIGDALNGIFSTMSNLAKSAVKAVTNIVARITTVFGSLPHALASVLTEASKVVGDMLHNIFTAVNIADILKVVNGALLAKIILSIKKGLESPLEGIFDNLKSMASPVTGVLDSVRDSLSQWQNQLKVHTLMGLAGAVALLAVAVTALSKINGKSLVSGLSAVTILLGELAGTIVAFSMVMDTKNAAAMSKAVAGLIGLSVAIYILQKALVSLAKLNWNDLAKGLTGVGALLAMLLGMSAALKKLQTELVTGSAGLILFAGALNVLSLAVKQLSTLSVSELAKGLGGIAVLLASIAGFMALTKGLSVGVVGAAGILVLSASLVVISNAVKELGALDLKTLAKGLGAITILLGELFAFSAFLGAGGLALSAGAIGIVALSAGLVILSKALVTLGRQKMSTIGKGLLALAGSLTILLAAVIPMALALPGAAALLVIAGALTVLTPQLMLLGSMSLGSVGTALLALAGAFAVLGGAALLLSPLIPVILALSAALGVIGLSVLAFGAGLTAVGAGITSISLAFETFAASLASVAASSSTLFENVLKFVANILTLGPQLLAIISQLIVSISETLATNGAKIAENITTFILALLKEFNRLLPQIAGTIGKLFTLIMQAIEKGVPRMVQVGATVLRSILQGIADNIETVAATGMEIITGLINGISEGLPDLIDAGFNLIISFMNGLADAVVNNAAEFGAACARIGEALVSAIGLGISGYIGELFGTGKKAGDKFAKGVDSKKDKAQGSGKKLTKEVAKGAKKDKTGLSSVGKWIVSGLKGGIENNSGPLSGTGTSLASKFLGAFKKKLGIASPSKVMKKNGEWIVKGLTAGLNKNENLVADSGKDLADTFVKGFKSAVATDLSLGEIGIAYNSAVKAQIDSIKKTMKYGQGVFESLVKNYGASLLKNNVFSTTGYENLSKSVSYYAEQLYKESDSYKSANKTYKANQKTLEKYQKKLKETADKKEKWAKREKKLAKEINELEKKRNKTAADKTKLKALKKEQKEGQSLAQTYKDLKQNVKDAKKQIKADQKELANSIKQTYLDLRNSIKDAVESYTDPLKISLDTQANLFEKFGSDTGILFMDILDNMQSQVEGVEEWNKNLEELLAKGFSEGLVNKLKSMGTEGVEYVNSFMTATTEEMNKANEMFAKSSQQSKEKYLADFKESLQAAKDWSANMQKLAKEGYDKDFLKKLGDQGVEGNSYAEMLLGLSDDEKKEFQSMWKEYSKLGGTIANDVIASYVYSGESAGKGFLSTLAKTISEESPEAKKAKDSMEKVTKAATKGITKGVKSNAKKAVKETVSGLEDSLRSNSSKLSSAGSTMGEAVKSGFKSKISSTSGKKWAANLSDGLAEGLTTGGKVIKGAAVESAQSAYDGIIDVSNSAHSTLLANAKSVASQIKEMLTEAYKVDAAPTITPVIDTKNAKEANNAVKNSGKNAKETAIQVKGGLKSNTKLASASSTSVGTVVNFTQNNNSPKALSSTEVYRQTNNAFSKFVKSTK